MKKLIFAFLSCLMLGVAAPSFASTDGPAEFVRENAKQVLDLLKKDDGKNSRKIREQLEALVLPKFDFKRMTAFAVGKNWRVATPAQQTELTAQFQTLLTRVYASTMTRYKNAQIDVKQNAVLSPGGLEATVKTDVTLPNGSDKKPISVDYTLYHTQQGWRVYNVSVEGASLVTAYRNQFDTEVRSNGVDGLIRSLREKNAKLGSGA
ncbi:MlaC/ttg2D family ABC transporter substrate-binding protein [Paludibacterium yongneupense]|uniref:MlaC/ttg2D family ABC transporter substrate-binding protein n=1 Tax=Paludibacterium yongneupense TaxID=400061 RepID=UPI000422CB47|nr:ABC transporter substrate-binding protein [Paludibacterium yongneupense]